ncbi:unnamed protein product [Periconia digitata]|uniref:Cellobiose dehydrogenase-like cytochrome domain-containing protein n=1 Tax=Periconia digitata TaxID=1303443 RepID=A0A9W4U8H2_9PLEO|nr:unnamed protein product [Periconia digitata]
MLHLPASKNPSQRYHKSTRICSRNRNRLGVALYLLFFTKPTVSQVTEAFTDPVTGINFQRFFGARTGFSFGIALPENPSTDFIGQISCPIPSGSGWAGIALQDDMEGPLLLAAWPNGDTVVSTFRVAEDEDENPPVVQGEFRAIDIPSGTSVNDTHMTWTFLCQNCVGNGETGFTAQDTAGTVEMGWGLADRAVSNAGDPAAELSFHNVGFGGFDAVLSLARSPLFGEWALLAGVESNGSTTPISVLPPGTFVGGDGGDDDDSGDESDDDD